jgi:serine/threonine protein kinase
MKGNNMINIHDAKSILSVTQVGDLFTNDADKIKTEYKDLAKIWHPDMNSDPDASTVFAFISELYQKALNLLSVGKWEKKNYIQLQIKDNKRIDISYLREHQFELGVMYVCNKHIIYVFDTDKKVFYDNALTQIKGLKYTSDRMKTEISRFMPSIISSYETIDDKYVYVISKTEDTYCLVDILNYYDGIIPDRHVAWVMTRLCNLLCYLDYSGLSHNGININSCFVSPKYHSIMLYGGWSYTKKQGEKLIGTSKEIFDVMPLSVKNSKLSSILTDIESVKLIGRTLLGDRTGIRLVSKGIPKPFVDWLCDGATSNAITESKRWDETIVESYGARKFISMDVIKDKVYNL